MKLGVRDRIALNAILPVEGDIRTLKTIMKLRESLLFSEEEVKEFGITQEGGRVMWTGNKAKEIEIGDLGKEIIVKKLKELDSQKKLTADHIAVWDLFLPGK